jgi:hypothetical protein
MKLNRSHLLVPANITLRSRAALAGRAKSSLGNARGPDRHTHGRILDADLAPKIFIRSSDLGAAESVNAGREPYAQAGKCSLCARLPEWRAKRTRHAWLARKVG